MILGATHQLGMCVAEVADGKAGAESEGGNDEEAGRTAASGWDNDRVVLPGKVSEPVMIRRRTLLERAAAADQLPHALARRAARQYVPIHSSSCNMMNSAQFYTIHTI